ncbi:MAG: radical SAM protein [Planctomycetota bacterium]|jgi:organic radical activating enzyme
MNPLPVLAEGHPAGTTVGRRETLVIPEPSGRPAPPRPEEGVISWNINTACNYRCTYCTQRFKEDRGRWSRDTPRFLAAFGRLPGRFEIKISGGEPFVHPTLNEITLGLATLGHRISIVTNFSATRRELRAFANAARGRVGVFSCSLHLEYIDTEAAVDAFVEKAAWLQALLLELADPDLARPSLVVTSVATRGALPRLAAMKARFEAAQVRFKVQPEKQNRDLIRYTEQEKLAILALGGHNDTGRIAHSFRGHPCWAGARYFILDDEGTAFRCYPARRYKVERMGNFLDADFRLPKEPAMCLYAYCNCTVPISRQMMAGTEEKR